MTAAAAQQRGIPPDTATVLYRTTDEIREFCMEFPSKRARIEELTRATTGKRIVVIDEHQEKNHVRSENV